MNARPAITTGGKVSQGPAWGLKEQLGRLGKNHGGGCSSAGEQHQDRGERSKIRVSVTGPALAHKIEEVRCLCAHKGKLSFFQSHQVRLCSPSIWRAFFVALKSTVCVDYTVRCVCAQETADGCSVLATLVHKSHPP